MPSWLKLTLAALAAFGLGFAAARGFPPADPASARNLSWERRGDTARLTAKAPGESYLIVQSASVGSSPSWSVVTAETLNVTKFPVAVYRLQPYLSCARPLQCNKCYDCPPGPSPGLLREARLYFGRPDSASQYPHFQVCPRTHSLVYSSAAVSAGGVVAVREARPERAGTEMEALELDRGDREGALTLLMEAYGVALYRYCRQMVVDPDLADDVHQLTFVQAFEGLGRFAAARLCAPGSSASPDTAAWMLSSPGAAGGRGSNRRMNYPSDRSPAERRKST